MRFNIGDNINLLGSATLLVGLVVLLVFTVTKTVQHHSCCFEKTCTNISINRDHFLLAQCQTRDRGTWEWSALDLNLLIAIGKEGSLEFEPGYED